MKKFVVSIIAFALCACNSINKSLPSETIGSDELIADATPIPKAQLKLVAVGDNLIHGAVYKAAALGNSYNFKPFYENIIPYLQGSDITYVNLETLAAGVSYGLSNYPNFNGPTQIIDDLIMTGFNWLALSSNHSLDKGVNALLDQYDYIHSNYNVITTGVHSTKQETNYFIKTINDIKVGFLGYTYGLNGHILPEEYDYLVDLMDTEVIIKDLNELSEYSDIQLVSVHWGNEYQMQPNDQQLQLAQLLSDNGADIIIGTHPHVIQPMQVLMQPNGLESVVVYSLGNFISAQDQMQCMLESMLKIQLSYDFMNNTHTFEHIELIPLINHIENRFNQFKVIPLSDYTSEDLTRHTLNAGNYSLNYFYDLWNEVYPDYLISFR